MQWQKDFIADIYTPEGKVKKHTVFLSGPRKCGKSALTAMLMLYTVFNDKESYQEISVTAASFDQAKKTVFQIFKEFLLVSDFNKKDYKVRSEVVKFKDSIVQVASSNENSLAGLQSTVVVAEELGRMENKSAIKSLADGLLLSENKLLIYLTNPSEKDSSHFSYDIFNKAKAESKIKDSEWAVKIFSAEPKDDPYKVATWRKANPNLKNKHYKDIVLKTYKEQAKDAANSLLAEVHFKRAYLGMWIKNDYTKWIDGSLWKTKADTGEYGDIHAGIDLSMSRDRTCVCITEKTADGGYYFRPLYYLPEPALDKMRKTKRELTKRWINQGYIKLQKTPVIFQAAILKDLESIYKKAKSFDYSILDLASGGFEFSEKIKQLGIETKPLSCVPSVMSPLINELSRVNEGGVFYYDGNPVFKSDFKNTLLSSYQSRGYRGVTRASVWDSIDGSVAALLSVEQHLKQPKLNSECLIF